jgi:hypothetical protein
MRLHQDIRLVLGSFLFATAAPVVSQGHDLELRMQCLRSADAVALRINLRNVGSTDTAVVLGTSIGNGQRYAADSLVLDFKRSQNDDAEGFRPTLGAVFGRIDPWIVTLPAASEFSFERPEDYFFSSRGDPLEIGSSGFIRLRLIQERFAGELVGAALVKVSTDQLQTEWVRVPGECHVG